MKILLFAVLVLIAVIPVAIVLDIHQETKEFNKGVCKICGGKLVHIREDEELGAVYKCDKCGYEVNVTYAMVDKDYENEN